MKKTNFNIIFDLDGTLVHSVPDMHHAISKTLSKYNLKKYKTIYDHPDVRYISLPLYDKQSRLVRCISDLERLQYEFGLCESIESLRIGTEITIGQIREMSESLNLTPFSKHNIIIIIVP